MAPSDAAEILSCVVKYVLFIMAPLMEVYAPVAHVFGMNGRVDLTTCSDGNCLKRQGVGF